MYDMWGTQYERTDYTLWHCIAAAMLNVVINSTLNASCVFSLTSLTVEPWVPLHVAIFY